MPDAPMHRAPEAIRSTTLTDEAEARYVDRLYRILRSARLNLHYPDARKLQSHVRCLHPDVHRGLYDGVQMNLNSGLPTYREWTRVQTDVSLAAEQLQKLGSRATLEKKAASGEAIHEKLLKKHKYYSDIVDAQLTPLGDMEVKLRRVDHRERTAYFHVILDKLDASGLFVRYSIDLAQTDSAWSQKVVRLDEENAEHTEEFQALIYKFTSLDAEFTFAKLAGLGGLEVQKVAKGTVGPIYFAREQAPPELRGLFDGHDDAFVAMFALDMVANDIAEDRDNDPIDSIMSRSMSEEAAQAYERVRDQSDCKVFKDRKFVVPRALMSAVREYCADHGTKNIVYPVR